MSQQQLFGPSLQLGTAVETNEPMLLYGDGLKRHRIVYAISGMGKSKLMASMCVQSLNQRIPFACVDPHSDLADDILSILIQTGFFTNTKAYDRLWYVTFSDANRSIPFNWLKQPFPHHQIAENFVEVVKRAWTSLGDSAVNFENIALAACMVLLENQRPLTDLLQLISNPVFRGQLLTQVSDEFVLDFFRNRFSTYTKGLSESTLRRAFLLNFSPPLRHALEATENLINFSSLMDNKVSVIFDLGGLDAQTQRFLGVLLTVGFERAMLARASLPVTKRTPYHLFIDEWHQFLSASPESLSRMLDLTRKFGMTLTLSSQNFTQTASLRASLQNCLQIALRLGHDDAKVAASRFVPTISPQVKPSVWQQIFLGVLGMAPPKENEEWKKADWWETRLRHLPKAHALIHLDGLTTEIQTLIVPPLVQEQELARIKEEYAKQLLRPNPTKPAPKVAQEEDEKEEQIAVPPVIDLTERRQKHALTSQATLPPAEEQSKRRRAPIDEEL